MLRHQLRDLLPFEALFFFIRALLSLMLFSITGCVPAPALLVDQADGTGGIGRNITEWASRPRECGPVDVLPQLLSRGGMGEGNGRRVFRREKQQAWGAGLA